MNIICFHNPDEENGFLSNWYSSSISVNGMVFTSVEQYMMYQKAVCFHDNEVAKQTLATQDVVRIKELGRLVLGYNEKVRIYLVMH